MHWTAALLWLALAAPQDGADWSREEALEEFHDIIFAPGTDATRASQRRERATAWLKRVDTSRIDLGDRAFVTGIASYYVRDVDATRRVFLAHMRERGDFPHTDYDAHVGRILLTMAAQALSADDIDTTELVLPKALALASDRKLFYKRIGASLRQGEPTEKRLAILNELLRSVLDDGELDARAKQETFAFIYGSTVTRASRSQPQPARGSARGARPLKPFRTRDLDGRDISLEDYRGKVVLVDFWATWCGPCIREAPNVVATYQKYHDRGFEVIGISLDRAGAEEKLRATAERLGMSWRQIFDGGGWRSRLAVENRIRSIPSTFLIDRSGKVRYTQVRGKTLGVKVRELIEEPVPAKEATESP